MCFDAAKNPLATLGRWAIFPIQEMGRIAIFFLKGFFHIFSFPFQISKITEQIYFIGGEGNGTYRQTALDLATEDEDGALNGRRLRFRLKFEQGQDESSERMELFEIQELWAEWHREDERN